MGLRLLSPSRPESIRWQRRLTVVEELGETVVAAASEHGLNLEFDTERGCGMADLTLRGGHKLNLRTSAVYPNKARDPVAGRIDVGLRAPYDAENVMVINTVIFNEADYPYERPTADSPAFLWRDYEDIVQLREGLSAQFTVIAQNPEQFYGAYALKLFQDEPGNSPNALTR